MRGAFNTSDKTRKPAINITSLIDVMFLLLIFFMVSSTFKQFTGIDVTLPQAENASSQESTSHEIVVSESGTYYLEGEQVDSAGLRDGLKAIIAEDEDGTFVLRADASAEFGPVLRAMDIAREIGGERLIIPTDLLTDETH